MIAILIKLNDISKTRIASDTIGEYCPRLSNEIAIAYKNYNRVVIYRYKEDEDRDKDLKLIDSALGACSAEVKV